MKDGKGKNIIMLFGSTLLAATGQYLFKLSFNTPASFYEIFIIGLAAYLLSTVIYLIVLSRVHLSWAYGIGGLSYIFATIFAYSLLSESIPTLRWAGVAVIFLGVVLIGMS